MRLVSLALIALSFAACGDLDAPSVAEEQQALLPGTLDLPTEFARCERGGSGIGAELRAIDWAPTAGLTEHLRLVQTPAVAAAPAFMPTRRITSAEIFAGAASLQVEVTGSDASGRVGGQIIVSTVDGAADLGSLEVFGRCGQFAMYENLPFEGEAPTELLLEWTGEHDGVPFRVARVVEVR